MWNVFELYNSRLLNNKLQRSVLHVTLFSIQLVITNFGNNHHNL
jgi:hypothetical protein